MGEGSFFQVMSCCIFGFFLISIFPNAAYSDQNLVCDGKLERIKDLDGIYFSPVHFDSFRIVPKSDCRADKTCRYDLYIKSGEKSYLGRANVLLDSLCASVFVRTTSMEINNAMDEANSTDHPSRVQVIGGNYLDLNEFDYKTTTITSFIFSEGGQEYSFHAISDEYSVNGWEQENGVWHGDSGGGGGGLWYPYVKQEYILTEEKDL